MDKNAAITAIKGPKLKKRALRQLIITIIIIMLVIALLSIEGSISLFEFCEK